MATSLHGGANQRTRTPVESTPEATTREVPRNARFNVRSIALLAFVGLTLLLSVAIPARQTWLITRLLRETIEVLAPARLLVQQLQSGLAKERVVLQSYALSGNDSLLREYQATAAGDERRITALAHLASRLDSTSALSVHTIRRRVGAWHLATNAMIEQRTTRARFAAALEAGDTLHDSSMSAIAALLTDLATHSETHDDRVSSLERLSIGANAVLVLAALVAMAGVLVLTLRERRLAAALGLRFAEESALRQMARRLSAAVTRDQVLRCIVEGAPATTRARDGEHRDRGR